MLVMNINDEEYSYKANLMYKKLDLPRIIEKFILIIINYLQIIIL